MPSRVSARASSAASSRKSATPSNTGASVFIPEEPATPTSSPNLRANVVEIFSDAQRSNTGHRKLVVKLRKIQEVCCGLRSQKGKGKGGDDDVGGEYSNIDSGLDNREGIAEKEINMEITRCILRVLGVKKAEGAGDRVIKFLGTFLKTATDKDFEIFSQGDPDETIALPETPSSRLTFTIVSTIVPILGAKERTVRYRVTQIISHIVNSLDSIDDELYHLIRQGLIRRIRDKEPTVRVQAVMGLGRLAGNEEDEEDRVDSGSAALLDKLLDVLQNDTSAEVRRTLLLNLPLTPTTLPFLLERARDIDAPTRRALYSRLLPTLGDFRHLSLTMREKILRWGLRDRDESVRKAAGRLFYERWIEDCASSYNNSNNEEENAGDKTSAPVIPALIELLERVDVVNSGMDNGIAHEAMKTFWEGRPDYREAVVFDDNFWGSLTAESAFMARSFNDFCRQDGDGRYEYLADEKIPEVTALAFYLHKYSNTLLLRMNNPAEAEGGEEENMEYEFIVEQLLHISLTLDYSDEVGRRKMFSLLRETLTVSNLPDEVTKLTIEVLRCVCGPDAAGEGEFCGVVLEAVAEVHDVIMSEEDSFVSAQSEISEDSTDKEKAEKGQTPQGGDGDGKAGEDGDSPFNKEEAKAKVLREIMINMKCLYIAKCMLQNVEGNLQDNIHLVTMLNNLVVPAVRSHETPVRERGLECLGLCCLLDKTLAEEHMSLFIHCYSKGYEGLQELSLKTLSDILATHHSILTPVESPNDPNSVIPPPFQKPLLKVFGRALKTTSSAYVQSTAVTALSKLLLTNTLSPSGPSVPPSIKELNENSVETILQALVLSFFHPRTRDNLALRQALTYFFPVYCHSRLANAQHMRNIAVSVLRSVLAAADDFYALEAEEDSDGEIDESVGEKEVKVLMTGVVGMLTEWTDDRRIIGLGGGADPLQPGVLANTINPSESLHLALAKDILQRVMGIGSYTTASREERKFLFSMLSKLHIPTPAPVPSRASSRAPEGPSFVDERESLRSSIRSSKSELLQPSIEDDDKLPLLVKELLDQAITSGIAPDATSRNALVKLKNSVLKILAGTTTTRASEKERSVSRSVSRSGSVPVPRGKERERVNVKEEPIEEDWEQERAAEDSVAASRRSSEAPSRLSEAPSRHSVAGSRRTSEAPSEAPSRRRVSSSRRSSEAPSRLSETPSRRSVSGSRRTSETPSEAASRRSVASSRRTSEAPSEAPSRRRVSSSRRSSAAPSRLSEAPSRLSSVHESRQDDYDDDNDDTVIRRRMTSVSVASQSDAGTDDGDRTL